MMQASVVDAEYWETVDDVEIGRRVRAARYYAEKKVPEVLEALGVSDNTLRRMERGTRPARAGELEALARLCGLPPEFFTMDFAHPDEDVPDVLERLARVESQVTSLKKRTDALEDRADEIDLQIQEQDLGAGGEPSQPQHDEGAGDEAGEGDPPG